MKPEKPLTTENTENTEKEKPSVARSLGITSRVTPEIQPTLLFSVFSVNSVVSN